MEKSTTAKNKNTRNKISNSRIATVAKSGVLQFGFLLHIFLDCVQCAVDLASLRQAERRAMHAASGPQLECIESRASCMQMHCMRAEELEEFRPSVPRLIDHLIFSVRA
jgi:hypothetical protein